MIALFENPNDPLWSYAWRPSPEILAWFRRFLERAPKMWVSPSSGHVYAINPETKTMTLAHGDPHDARHWHDKNKVTLAELGWTVLDGPDSPNDEMAFAERLTAQQIVSALVEDTAGPYDKKTATLQYRPISTGDQWKWYWVLLPPDRSKAYATGDADSRAAAATAARLKARELHIVISDIDVMTAKKG